MSVARDPRGAKAIPVKQRFEAMFTRGTSDGCWEWIGHRQSRGYGWFNCGTGGSHLAHRVAYMLYRGSIPAEALILHSCDNRGCVNPAHLSIGTAKQNTQQARERARMERVHKLDASAVHAIRESDAAAADLAAVHGISEGHASDVRRRRRGHGRGILISKVA